MESGIISRAAVAVVLHAFPLLLVALFLTGVQSTLFGPVKYSILPVVLRPEELTGGNGLVEMGTSVSILIGMIAGGMIFELAGASGPWARSEEHTSELQSLMRISYSVFCLKKQKQ